MGDARAIGVAAFSQGLAHHRAGQRGRASFGSVLSAASRNGPQQPVPQRALARQHIADALVRPRATAVGQRQIVGRPACRAPGASGSNTTRECGRHWAGWSSARRSSGRRNRSPGRSSPASRSARRCVSDSRTRPDCPTGPDDCRCRSRHRRWDRNRSGSGRPPGPRLRTAATCAPRAARTVAARQAGQPGADDIGLAVIAAHASEKSVAQHQRQQPALAERDAVARRRQSPAPRWRAGFRNRPRPSAAASRCGPSGFAARIRVGLVIMLMRQRRDLAADRVDRGLGDDRRWDRI